MSGTEPSPAAAGGRVFFQTPLNAPGAREDSSQVSAQQHKQQQQRRQQQGKVTVKYDRKELRKRLVLEEWIVEQLSELYGCEVLSPFIPITSPYAPGGDVTLFTHLMWLKGPQTLSVIYCSLLSAVTYCGRAD